MEKGYTKKKFRRKIPKVGRSYKRHKNEPKSFDKSKDINDLIEEILEESNMSKSIEQEMDEMADKMEKSTADPKQSLMKTIEELGSEGIKKSMDELDEDQKVLLKSVLEEMAKGKKAVSMDDKYEGEKKVSTIESTRIEQEQRSDDADEKLVKPAAKDIKHQGDESPEGKEGQVIKGCDEKMIKEAKKEMDKKEDKESKIKKSLEEVRALKDEVIKSYEDAGLEYSDELVKAEMKKRMNKEEDQVEMGGQDKGGKKDRADKAAPDEIKVGKDAEETADEAVAKVSKVKKSETSEEVAIKAKEIIKKSLPIADVNARLRAGTGGRNFHFSIDNYYNEALAKAQGKNTEGETLEKSEGEESKENLNDIIEKGFDQTMCDVASEELQKSQIIGDFTNNSFSDENLADAMNISEGELKEILGEPVAKAKPVEEKKKGKKVVSMGVRG